MARKNNQQNIKGLQIKLTNLETILKWSKGEILNAKTLNYKNGQPDEGGLFDQRIFGPVKDYQCACGKYKGIRYKGRVCEKCGVEVIKSSVRRERMAHIMLKTPVVHTWFANDLPNQSKISLALGLDNNDVRNIIYYQSYIIVDNAGFKKYFSNNQLITFDEKFDQSTKARFECKKLLSDEIMPKLDKKSADYIAAQEMLEQLTQGDYTFNIDAILEFISEKTGIKFGIGAEAILELLKKINVNAEIKSLKSKINPDSPTFSRDVNRLKILNWFAQSGNKLEWMVVSAIPVTPPDTRPLMQLETGNYVSSDINELYRKIIMRNKTLESTIANEAPTRIIYEQKRNLQMAVDELFDSGVAKTSSGKTFKSITDYLKGKTGLFRQNLLGKRVDFSARSAIVGGPDLKMYEAGVPVEIALKIFRPFIIAKLISDTDANGEQIQPIAENIKDAERILIQRDDRIWPILHEVIKTRPIILNRAPSLHKLSIGAFEVKLTEGKAIRLHPLVTTGFNADFDGDTMAIHLPLSEEAINEARGLVMSINNLIIPKDGRPAINPTIDMPLGVFYATSIRKEKAGEGIAFSSIDEIKSALSSNAVQLQTIIAVSSNIYPNKKNVAKNKIIITTVGRTLFNDILPEDYDLLKAIKVLDYGSDFHEAIKNVTNDYIATDLGLSKSDIGKIISNLYAKYGNILTAKVSDKIKDFGFKYATQSGITFSVFDFPKYTNKYAYIDAAKEKISLLENQYKKGLLTDDERYIRVIDTWNKVKENVVKDMEEILADPKNFEQSIIYLNKSGARGNLSQFTQMIGLRGLMSKSFNYSNNKSESNIIKDTIENPILNSFFDGLTIMEYFNSAYGGRKSMIDTQLKTSKSGYMTRKLVDCAQDVIIKQDDCGVTSGIIVSAIRNEQNQIVEKLSERIYGRTSVYDIKVDDKIVAKANEIISADAAREIEASGIEEVEIYSPVKCKCKGGICKKCFGLDISTNELIKLHTPIGVIAAQSIGEPVTQLNMRAKATGGVAGGTQLAQGYERIKQLLDVVDPKEHEFAHMVEADGEVTDIEINENYRIVTIKYLSLTKTYKILNTSKLLVKVGDKVKLGDKINVGNFSLKQLVKNCGVVMARNYIIAECQKVYRLQGIEINDKYLEIIVRQMTNNMLITNSGDYEDLFIGQSVTISELIDINNELLTNGKKPIIAVCELLGLDSIPSRSASFLNAASFQYTKKILINAAIKGQVDELKSLKENIMLGRLIPVGTGLKSVEEINAKGEETYREEY